MSFVNFRFLSLNGMDEIVPFIINYYNSSLSFDTGFDFLDKNTSFESTI